MAEEQLSPREDGERGVGKRASTGSRSSDAPTRRSGIRMSTASSAASSGHSTRGSLRVSKDGRIIETNTTADGKLVQDHTLASLLLSGRAGEYMLDTKTAARTSRASQASKLSTLAEDLGEDMEEPEELEFFPDPPCVLPLEDELGPEDGDGRPEAKGVNSYWKDYARWLQCWPDVQEAAARNRKFIAGIGQGRARTSSVVRFRVFVNVSPCPVGLRSQPSQAEADKTGDVVQPGQLVSIQNNITEKDGIRYYKLRDANGYLFDTKDNKPVMVEATNVEAGQWWYRVCAQECVEVRAAPSTGDELRSGWVMCPQEVAVVSLRCRVGGVEFLLLADGRGWVFSHKQSEDGTGREMRGEHNCVLEECENDFHDGSSALDFRHAVPPTHEVVEVGNWLYVVQELPVLCLGAHKHGTFLNPGDLLQVDKRAIANGDDVQGTTIHNRLWVRLMDGRGWVPVTDENRKELIKEQDLNDLTYPSWFQGSKDLDTPEKSWMVGFV